MRTHLIPHLCKLPVTCLTFPLPPLEPFFGGGGYCKLRHTFVLLAFLAVARVGQFAFAQLCPGLCEGYV